MFEGIYQTLTSLGYTHPLHPTVTHLPVGLIIGATIFGMIAWLLRSNNVARTAQHCIALGFVSVLPTAALGIMDWQHYYAGAWLFPIKMKIILAGALLLFLLIGLLLSRQSGSHARNLLPVYILSLLCVVGIGYFGGELVYGKKNVEASSASELVQKGAQLFNQSCSFCHYSDKKDARVGPGLAGLFDSKNLPASGRVVTDASIRMQLAEPYKDMPEFSSLTEEEINSLIAFLRSL